jgi:hypothetical protein
MDAYLYAALPLAALSKKPAAVSKCDMKLWCALNSPLEAHLHNAQNKGI